MVSWSTPAISESPPGNCRVLVERTQQFRRGSDRFGFGRARAAGDAVQMSSVGDARVTSRVLGVLRDNRRAVVNAYPAAADQHPYALADQPPRPRVGVGVDHHRAVGVDPSGAAHLDPGCAAGGEPVFEAGGGRVGSSVVGRGVGGWRGCLAFVQDGLGAAVEVMEGELGAELLGLRARFGARAGDGLADAGQASLGVVVFVFEGQEPAAAVVGRGHECHVAVIGVSWTAV